MVSIKQLLEAGVHFGHQTRRWNPKMGRYIFGERNGIYIVNLEKTESELKKACEFLSGLVSRGEYVLFVGTKKQAQQAIVEEANRCGMFYVDQRWLGGTLTNFETIRKSVHRLETIEQMRSDGTFEKLKKKEVAVLNKEMSKLLKNLGGIRNMDKLPGALFVVDVKKEETAVKEARRLDIPVVALVDTNSDPDMIDFVIPGNDDAIKSIRVVCQAVAEAVAEEKKKFEQSAPKTKKKKEEKALSETVPTDDAVEEIVEEIVGIKVEKEEASRGKKILPKAKKASDEELKRRSVKIKRKA
ncbi:MAG: 30S ribosomal protein S2 [Candidatus Omnitrophota bacterium]